MKKQWLDSFDEAYEIICTKTVCFDGRTIKIEVKKCLKGNLAGKFDCDCYEEVDCIQPKVKGKDSKTITAWVKIKIPWMDKNDANTAMKFALDKITEMFFATNGK